MCHCVEVLLIPFIAVSSKNCEEFAFSVLSFENIELEILNQVDVWIDFSSPAQLQNLLSSTTKVPVVSGTTGSSESEIQKIKKSSVGRPIFWASNMSLGIWALRQAMKSLSLIANFDFDIEDIHHNEKKDNPSGTAKTLQSDLSEIVGKKINRPVGKRLGGIFGIHKVTAASQNEIIILEHTALNREVFAEGAVKAAKWILNKKIGYYSMSDLGEK